LVSDAQLLERIIAFAHAEATPAPEESTEPSVLQGVPLSPGIGFGEAFVVDSIDEWRRTAELHSDDPAEERRRLDQALIAARDEIARLSQRISALVGEDHGAILQAQLMIMQDRAIANDLRTCLENGSSAEGALIQTLDKYVAAFQRLKTPYFQERVYDIKDVFHRLLWHLRPQAGRPRTNGDDLTAVILVAHEAS